MTVPPSSVPPSSVPPSSVPPSSVSPSPVPLLAVRGLTVRFRTRRGTAHVVNDVSWDLHRGETLAVVGESGSGKSVSALALAGLLPVPPAVVTGQAWLARGDSDPAGHPAGDPAGSQASVEDGLDLISAGPEQLRRVRGDRIGMVFQDPMTSLNPYLTIGEQITEGIRAHRDVSARRAADRAVDLLRLVGIPDAPQRLGEHPHRLSGGMRQRVMIAIGLACEPDLLVADEPTTALDVTTQAQIVELVAGLQERLGMAVIWISHDLGVVARIARRVIVMYAGRVVEQAGVDALYACPRHPYTRGLLRSLPVIGRPGEDLAMIPGLPPDPCDLPPGCPFAPRCDVCGDPRCERDLPPLREVAPGHLVRTFHDLSKTAP